MSSERLPEAIQTLRCENSDQILSQAHILGQPPSRVRNLSLISDYSKESPWSDKHYRDLVGIEKEFSGHLIATLESDEAAGDLVEFGIRPGARGGHIYSRVRWGA